MNELIEVKELPEGIEGFLSELKPAQCTKWNYEKRCDEIDNSEKTLEKYNTGCELVKQSLREVYTFGQTVFRGTPKFCIAIKRIYENLYYVTDSSVSEAQCYGSSAKYQPSLSRYGTDEGFAKLIGKIGLSSTSAYRYKDLANFIDDKTDDFYPEFQGYSFSLLTEFWAYAGESYNRNLTSLIALTKVIPSNTSVDDMRQYRKVMKLLDGSRGVFLNYKWDEKQKLRKKTVSAVLKVYNELVQKEENEKLEATMSGVQNVVKEDKSVKTLPAADEITVKIDEYKKINDLARKAINIGKCDGCKHNGTNLNKCRCCRRYENLKDLFEN
ncbi:MAG: hypothetical protein K2L12_02710 [Clostridia bacterium]|nr:hypothetical protein [Clostridia bacterium]